MSIAIQQVKPAGSALYYCFLFIVCFLGGAIGGTVSTLMSVYLPVVVDELRLQRDGDFLVRAGAYINALFIFGWALGGFSWGVVSDTLGRKKAVVLAMTWYGLFTLMTGFAESWWMIVLCRFLSGFGVGGVLVTTITLVSEVWPQKKRAVVIGILSIAFPVGIFSAGLINYLVASWREAFLVGLIPLGLAMAGAAFMNESDNWLKNKDGRATKERGDRLFSQGHRKELVTGSLLFGAMLIGLWAIFSWLPTWVQTFVTDTDGQKERGIVMMLLGMGGLTGGFFSGWLLNRFKIRNVMLTCFGVASLMSFILFKTNQHFSPLIYAEVGIMAFFFGISQGALSSYIPQLFSTGVRATATGFCFNIGRLVTGTAVLFVGILVTTLGGYGNAIYIFSLVFVVGFFVVLFTAKRDKKLST